MAAQARLDRCRGRIAHNLEAILRAGHIVPHLPHDYRERYDPTYRQWHETTFDRSVRITCAVCGVRVNATTTDAAFKREWCPLGGTMQAVDALAAAMRVDVPHLDELAIAAGAPAVEMVALSKQPHIAR